MAFAIKIQEQIKNKVHHQIEQQVHKLEKIEAQHQHLNPENAFKRGFSFSTIDGESLMGKIAKPGKKLTTHSLNQLIESTITLVKKNGKI